MDFLMSTPQQFFQGVPFTSPLSFGPSLAAWYTAADATTITQAAGLATQWNDKNGKAPPLTAAGTARPTYGAAAYQQNAAGLTFDGVANVMTAANFPLQFPFSMFVFGQAINTAAPNIRLLSYTANGDPNDFGALTSAAILTKSGDSQGISSTRNSVQSPLLNDQSIQGIFFGTDFISMGAVFDGTNSTLYYDNWAASTPSANAGQLGPLGTLSIGGGQGTFWKSTISEVIILNRAMSVADRLNAQRWCISSRWNRIIVVEGDSIDQGSRDVGNSFGQMYMPNASPVPYLRNIAIGGSRLNSNPPSPSFIGDLIYRTAYTDAHGPGIGGSLQTILFCGIGSNDTGNNTPSNYTTAYGQYMAARKTTGAFKKSAVATILSRTDVLNNDVWRNAVNAILKSPAFLATYNIDVCVDYALDSIMGVDNAPTVNPTFFADQVHPNAAGNARLEPIFRTSMNAL